MVISVGTEPPGPPTWCCGLDYACLRHEFWNAVPAQVRAVARRVLVTTGGGDPDGASGRLAEAVRGALPAADVRLVIGPQANGAVPAGVLAVRRRDSLFDELREADLVVCGGGQTALEAIRLGIPAVVVLLAPNQTDTATRLEEAQVARVVWPGTDPVLDVRELGTNTAIRADLAVRGPRTIDGRGAARVASKIMSVTMGVT
jgi:spore coat polysaccharide biosynthesis predicted glycosyltransferase SpsG